MSGSALRKGYLRLQKKLRYRLQKQFILEGRVLTQFLAFAYNKNRHVFTLERTGYRHNSTKAQCLNACCNLNNDTPTAPQTSLYSFKW